MLNNALMLDVPGMISALAVGLIVYFFLGIPGFLILLAFLLLSVWASKEGEEEKKAFGVFEYSRGWKNVLSNGLVPALSAVLAGSFGPLPFLASLSSALADKFASEIGIFDREVYDVLTLQRVKAGTDGGISLLGTIWALIGAMSIAFLGMLLFNINLKEAVAVSVFGFLGSLADSIAGHFERRGIGNKEASNLIGTAVAFLLALIGVKMYGL